MKCIKKFVSLMLALVMVLAMGITASAQDHESGLDGTGTIKVTNATIGATYQLYKVFDATVGMVDGKEKITYTWPDADTWEENPYFERDTNGTISALTAAYKHGSQDQLSDEAIDWIKTKGAPCGTAVEAAEETLVFTNLTPGYYYVTSSVNNGAAITVDTANPDAVIIDKNQEPVWEEDGKNILDAEGKKVTESDASFGSEVNYEISVHATNYLKDEQIVEYFIYDTLGEGLDYVLDDDGKLQVAVKVGGEDVISEITSELSADKKSFMLTIPWAPKNGQDENGKDLYGDPLYTANAVITVTYKAVVNADAEIAGADAENYDKNTNKAWFDFRTEKDDPKEPGDPYHKKEEKTTTTYTYALGIQKVDENGEPLKGAKFTIDGVQAVAAGTKGIYNYVPEGTEGAVTEFETDDNGQLIIKGVDAGIYLVTETEAPEGYNTLAGPVEAAAQRESMTEYKKTHTVYYDADGNTVDEQVSEELTKEYTFTVNVSEYTIVNRTGAQLPSTGGMGTTIFYVVGGILVLAAVVLLITKKRMSKEV